MDPVGLMYRSISNDLNSVAMLDQQKLAAKSVSDMLKYIVAYHLTWLSS